MKFELYEYEYKIGYLKKIRLVCFDGLFLATLDLKSCS